MTIDLDTICEEAFLDKHFEALSPNGEYIGSEQQRFHDAEKCLEYVQETLRIAEKAGFGYAPSFYEQTLLDFLKEYVGHYEEWIKYRPNPWAMGGQSGAQAVNQGKAFRSWFERFYGNV